LASLTGGQAQTNRTVSLNRRGRIPFTTLGRFLFFVLLALAGYFRANAQGPPNRYVVVTFEERYHVSQHGAVAAAYLAFL